jgi:inorganic phosphate transporter, PiT family
MFIILLAFAVLFLAYWNGANDNFKGVATLYGSGTVNYRHAISLATVATFAGSICAIFLAQGLISNFSGKGLVPDETANNINFLISVGFGAAATILLATHIGLPISTTHSLVGGLLGAGMMSVGGAVNISQLGNAFFIPLLVSPLLALVLALIMYWIFTSIRQRFNLKKESCICVGKRGQIIPLRLLATGQPSVQLLDDEGFDITLSTDHECMELYSEKVAGIYIQNILNFAHTCSAAIVSFARGLNDTPKIAGLLVASQALDMHLGMIAIALAIAVGGVLNARKVAETVSKKITKLTHGQGFSANIVTGFLVIVASNFGVPVSTTHVSVGAIFGIGLVSGESDKRVIGNIVLSWLVTLPVAMCLSAIIFWLIN